MHRKKAFDPLLDPNAVKIPVMPTEEWNSTMIKGRNTKVAAVLR